MAPLLYNAALLALAPVLLLYLAYRVLVRGKSRQGFARRWGFQPNLRPAPPEGRIWMQAVSAGEVTAAAAVAAALRDKSPGVELVVTTTTPAGHQQARSLIPWAVCHSYFPFDFLPSVMLAVARLKPTLVASVETEIWPNWLWWARRTGRRVAIINGQITDRGLAGSRRWLPIYRWALSQPDLILAQSQEAAERFRKLGAPLDRVAAAGSVKFDQLVQAPLPETASAVLRALGTESGGALVVAGSTHPGEEELVVDAWSSVRAGGPRVPLLLAPRHTERASAVLAMLKARGISSRLRSDPASGSPVDVLVLDTMGELASLYRLATVVFVGGSLAPVGGHDILQPLLQGVPVLFGPHMHNQRDLSSQALAAGAAVRVESGEQLGKELRRLLQDPAEREALVGRGAELLAAHRGAATATADALLDLLASRGQ